MAFVRRLLSTIATGRCLYALNTAPGNHDNAGICQSSVIVIKSCQVQSVCICGRLLWPIGFFRLTAK